MAGSIPVVQLISINFKLHIMEKKQFYFEIETESGLTHSDMYGKPTGIYLHREKNSSYVGLNVWIDFGNDSGNLWFMGGLNDYPKEFLDQLKEGMSAGTLGSAPVADPAVIVEHGDRLSIDQTIRLIMALKSEEVTAAMVHQKLIDG